MSERPNCQAIDACRAKGTGHCRSCCMKALATANWQKPEYRAARAETAKASWTNGTYPKAIKAQHERAFGWIPEHLREERRALVAKFKIPKAEADQIIRDRMAFEGVSS